MRRRVLVAALAVLPCVAPRAGPAEASLGARIDLAAIAVEPDVIAWRRDFHAHPELSNREERTGRMVADRLRALGLEVRAPVARTGVVAVLRGGLPGPVVALRADMDALPVTEEVDLPFASKARATYGGREVGVMHACGHDAHTAILLGVARVLVSVRDDLPGTVKFLFQPAEEGPPPGEEGGAELMIREGALEDPAPSAIFGLHVWPDPPGTIHVRAGPAMASSDSLRILVRGQQTHAGRPWQGVDPVTVSAQILLALQTIASRQMDVTLAPSVVSIGSIHGGVRGNILPDTVEMMGTIRAFDSAMRADLHERIRRTAGKIAESAGATAEVTIGDGNPVTRNDPELVRRRLPTLRAVAGEGAVGESPLVTGAEDFARYQERVPGMFFFLGVAPRDVPPERIAPNHSPRFFVEESALIVGVRALAHLAVDELEAGASPAPRGAPEGARP